MIVSFQNQSYGQSLGQPRPDPLVPKRLYPRMTRRHLTPVLLNVTVPVISLIVFHIPTAPLPNLNMRSVGVRRPEIGQTSRIPRRPRLILSLNTAIPHAKASNYPSPHTQSREHHAYWHSNSESRTMESDIKYCHVCRKKEPPLDSSQSP